MSTFSTKVQVIEEILPYPDPEGLAEEDKTKNLELVRVSGWLCVAGKGSYQVGQKVVMIEPDTVIPQELEERAWENTKISRPKNGRIKATKFRHGVISPGLVLSLERCQLPETVTVGQEVSNILGTKKYESQELLDSKKVNNAPRKKPHPKFDKYIDIENFKRFTKVFKEDETISVTIKIHGCNARFSWQPTVIEDLTLPSLKKRSVRALVASLKEWTSKTKATLSKHWQRLSGTLPTHEFCVGSRAIEVNDPNQQTYFKENYYWKIAEDYDLAAKLEPGEILYGEIFGKIQKNFDYGVKKGSVSFLAFDVKIDGKYLDVDAFNRFCAERDIPTVPEVYRGPYSFEVIEKLRNGSDHDLDKHVPCREGIVIKAVPERTSPGFGRAILKAISDKYYLKDSSDLQ